MDIDLTRLSDNTLSASSPVLGGTFAVVTRASAVAPAAIAWDVDPAERRGITADMVWTALAFYEARTALLAERRAAVEERNQRVESVRLDTAMRLRMVDEAYDNRVRQAVEAYRRTLATEQGCTEVHQRAFAISLACTEVHRGALAGEML